MVENSYMKRVKEYLFKEQTSKETKYLRMKISNENFEILF